MWWLIETMKTDRCLVNYEKKKRRKRSVVFNIFGLIIGLLYLISIASAQDPQYSDDECGESEFKCICGIPRCVDLSLVNNGVKDCYDASDEKGQWDLSKCNNDTTNRDKRGAISELIRITNGGATTTFYEGERGRTRPVGLLTTTMGSFQVSGTTTEYITKLLATYIKGTYARILTTTSRIYHALPSTSPSLDQSGNSDVRPTGFIASTLSTEINGYATTVHTTDFYRTYIDNTYAQQISAYSSVYYPPWYTQPILQSESASSFEETYEDVGEIYPTPTLLTESPLQTLHVSNNGQFGRVVINPVLPAPPMDIPDLDIQNGILEFKSADQEVKVTGTHADFVKGDTTYKIFTGTYTQNSRTYLFFFGNSALSPSRPGISSQQTILVENGPQKDHLVVDMGEKLKLIVPGTKERTTIDTTLNGQPVEGVMVEIEGSENPELITVQGATPTLAPTPDEYNSPRIHAVTITLDKNIRKVVSKGKSQSPPPTQPVPDEDLNEIPRGRAANFRDMGHPIAEMQIQPTRVGKVLSLPTYTVGGQDAEVPKNYYEATTSSDEELTTYNVESSTSSSSSSSSRNGKQPVFQKPGQKSSGKGFSRRPKTFSDLKDMNNGGGMDNDLMSEASNPHATVTYVGFADFTTTVGNTVIVFMPRTRMLEDYSSGIEASKTQSPQLDPTRYSYTTEDQPLPVTTTPKKVEEIEVIEITTPKPPPPPPVVPKLPKSSKIIKSSASPSEVLVSGRETLFSEQIQSTKSTSALTSTVVPRPSKSTPRFVPKAKLTRTDDLAYRTTQTSVFQSDVVNPTGLVTSIGGSIVRDSTTTLFTSLVIGTYIDGSYAQVIKSTSTVFYLVPSKTVEGISTSIQPTKITSIVQPTTSTTLPPPSKDKVEFTTKSQIPIAHFSYEVTTSHPEDPEEITTTFERAEVRVTSTTTESTGPESEESTTFSGNSIEEEKTTTSLPINAKKQDLEDALNEIERARKVAGKASEQIIVPAKEKERETTLEKPTTTPVPPESVVEPETERVTPSEEDEIPEVEQTIYITKTVPTTVFRTYTYFTTYFIPRDDETVSSVISREVTSTAVGFVKKTFSSIVPSPSVSVPQVEATASQAVYTTPKAPENLTPTPDVEGEEEEEDETEEEDGPITLYKTYFTTYTYLTTFFTGETSSISSREEVISSVSTITQPPSALIVSVTPSAIAEISTPIIVKEVEPSVVEQTILQTFYTTYTYFSTLFNGFEASTRSRIEVITNVVPTTIRSKIIPSASTSQISPTAHEGRKAPPASAVIEEFKDLNEVGSNLSESSAMEPSDYYELESSEMTTDRSVYNEQELEEENPDKELEATPALKTLFTTFSFFTTYYKGGSSTVATRLQTVTNVVSNSVEESESESLPVFPITYLTTFTYWTTHFKDQSTIVTSREETISNIVTPGVDDIVGTSTSAIEVKVEPTKEPEVASREPKNVETTEEPEVELTTYFTTYTYFTSSYIGDKTIVNSRLETVTNVITGTPTPTPVVEPDTQTARAVGNNAPPPPEQELEHEDLPVGLLSTVTNEEVNDRTTTQYLTDVYGTYIDGIYAQVLESTSRVILPTASESTIFIHEPTVTPTGVIGLNEGKTIEGDGLATTFFRTQTVGAIIDGSYAQVISSSSSISKNPLITPTLDEFQKTGLVRVIDGSQVQEDKTTFYTSSIYGTVIDGQYGQIIESTTRYFVNPSATQAPVEVSEAPVIAVVQSSESEEVPTTTEGQVEDSKESKRFPGVRGRGSRLSFNAPSSKSFTPFITPFASRSRPAFAPKRKSSDAVIVTRAEVTPTVTATLAPSSNRPPNQNRPRFRRPEGSSSSEEISTTPTPRLPTSTVRNRFQRPSATAPVSPSSSSQTVARSSPNPIVRVPSARRSNAFGASSSIVPSRPIVSRPSTSRFSLRPRGNSRTTTPQPTSSQSSLDETAEEEEQQQSEVAETSSTEAPKTTTLSSRFVNNRFRVNPKLNVANLLSTTTTERTTTTPRPRKSFTRPTLPTRGTPSTTSEPSEEEPGQVDDVPSEEAEEPAVVSSTTTSKPSLKSLIATRRPPNSLPRPTVPSQRPPNRQITTQLTTPRPTTTTTRRSFAPRARPLGFPSRGLVRGSTTTEKAPEENSELDYEESRNQPPASLTNENQPLNSGLLVDSLSVEAGKGDLIDSGSEYFETWSSYPYESYEDGRDVSSSFRRRRQARQVDYRSRRSRPEILRTNFRRGGSELTKSSLSLDNDQTSYPDSSSTSDDDYYYIDEPQSPPTTTTTTPRPNTRGSSRFRGRISPSPTRQSPFTLTHTPTRSSPVKNSPASLLTSRRSQSRYKPPESYTTPASPFSRGGTTSRFRSSNNYRTTSQYSNPTSKPKSRFSSPVRNRGSGYQPQLISSNNDEYYEPIPEKPKEILTVTHFLPSETTVPIVNGKSTEYKTILIPSPSIEILSPYQYTYSLQNGREIRVLNSEITSTPSFGIGGEVTKFIIKEVPTTSITFTPTTIRGRKTSFSHVLNTHYYTVEPTVSTLSPLNSPSGDQNAQLTNLLLSQLLGNLNLAGLQQQQQQNQQFQQNQGTEIGAPITQFSTKTSSYVTTITDYTSTVIPITLHGKAIKTTIIESQVNVLTATEIITESTVITPSPTMQLPQITQQALGNGLQGINPALLQGLLQQQLGQIQLIQPTLPQKLDDSVQPTQSVVTLYVSGKNPGEFSTVLSTVVSSSFSDGRRKRNILLEPTPAESIVEPTQILSNDFSKSSEVRFELEDGYSFTEGIIQYSQSAGDSRQPIRTQSLDSLSVPYG